MYKYTLIFSFILLFQSKIIAQSFSFGDPVFISYPLNLSINPVIAVNKQEKRFVVWEERASGSYNSPSRIYYTESADGVSWMTPYALTEENRYDGQPDITVDNEGYPHVVWAEWLGSVYYSRYDTDHWTEREEIEGGSDPYIIMDDSNRPHLFWSGLNGVRHSFYNNKEWSEPEMVIGNNAGGDLDLVKDSSGNIHIVTQGFIPNSDLPKILYRRQYGDIWGNIINISRDSLPSIIPQIEINSDGSILVVWEQIIQLSPSMWRMAYSRYADNEWSVPAFIPGQDSISRAGTASLVKVNSGETYLFCYMNNDDDGNAIYLVYNQREWSSPVSYTKVMTCIDAAKGSEKKFHLVLRKKTAWNIYYMNSDILTDINEEVQVQELTFNTLVNYPNPFNSNTIIYYRISESSQIEINIYDILGRKVRTLEKIYQEGGVHRVEFNAKDLPSGIYYCTLQTDEVNKTAKLVLLK